MINIWFKFEDKLQNTSKVIVFTRNHTDDDDGTKNNVLPVGGARDMPCSSHIKNNSNFEFAKVIKGTGKRIILNLTCQGNPC